PQLWGDEYKWIKHENCFMPNFEMWEFFEDDDGPSLDKMDEMTEPLEQDIDYMHITPLTHENKKLPLLYIMFMVLLNFVSIDLTMEVYIGNIIGKMTTVGWQEQRIVCLPTWDTSFRNSMLRRY
ncbi:hypothetical protein ACJX0J_012787, partial [Zea mays]